MASQRARVKFIDVIESVPQRSEIDSEIERVDFDIASVVDRSIDESMKIDRSVGEPSNEDDDVGDDDDDDDEDYDGDDDDA